MSDHILKEAMNEIMDVLQKHDIAGQIILVSKTHSEFRNKINPSWSCAWLQNIDIPGGQAVRFRATKADIPDIKQREEIVALTAHIFCQMRDLNAHSFQVCNSVMKELKSHVKITHESFSGYEPHKE